MGFEHHMYVVRCADGTLYTGYATDVARRVAAHNAGAGARYTKVRRPVTLVRSARFYTKSRALSAEARFKLLSRADKDRLLADPAPFESALLDALPGFAPEPAPEFIARSLCANRDEKYRDFQARLVPTLERERILGVRTPALRSIAKEALKRPAAEKFLASLPHATLEENQVHSFMIGATKDADEAFGRYERFLPYVDNWEVCDGLAVAPLAEDPARLRARALAWLGSGHAFAVRFAILAFMKAFLDERFEAGDFDRVADVAFEGEDAYYVRTAQAWYVAEALARRPEQALRWLERRARELPRELVRLAVRKARESRRVDAAVKERLKSL